MQRRGGEIRWGLQSPVQASMHQRAAPVQLGCPTEQAEILPGLLPDTMCPGLGLYVPELRGISSFSQQVLCTPAEELLSL